MPKRDTAFAVRSETAARLPMTAEEIAALFEAIQNNRSAGWGARKLSKLRIDDLYEAPEGVTWEGRVTFLFYAAWRKRDFLIKSLLAAGADPAVRHGLPHTDGSAKNYVVALPLERIAWFMRVLVRLRFVGSLRAARGTADVCGVCQAYPHTQFLCWEQCGHFACERCLWESLQRLGEDGAELPCPTCGARAQEVGAKRATVESSVSLGEAESKKDASHSELKCSICKSWMQLPCVSVPCCPSTSPTGERVLHSHVLRRDGPVRGDTLRHGELLYIGADNTLSSCIVVLLSGGLYVFATALGDAQSFPWSPFVVMSENKFDCYHKMASKDGGPELRKVTISFPTSDETVVFALADDQDGPRCGWIDDMAAAIRVARQAWFPHSVITTQPRVAHAGVAVATRIMAGYLLQGAQGGVQITAVYCELQAPARVDWAMVLYESARCERSACTIKIGPNTELHRLDGVECSQFSLDGFNFCARSVDERDVWLSAIESLISWLQRSVQEDFEEVRRIRRSVTDHIRTGDASRECSICGADRAACGCQDWVCGDCQYKNHSFRVDCRNCGSGRAQASLSHGTSDGSARGTAQDAAALTTAADETDSTCVL